MVSRSSFFRPLLVIVFLIATAGGATMAFGATDVTTPRAIPYTTSNVTTGLTQPTAVAIDDDGNIYVGENYVGVSPNFVSALVKKIDGKTGQVTVFAGGAAAKAPTGSSTCANPDVTVPGGGNNVGDGCPATSAFFGGSNGGIRGLAVWNNYLYIEDLGNYYIHRVNLATNIIEWVGGGSTSAAWVGDGPLTSTTPLFKPPTGFAVDPLNGNVYFGAGGTNAATIRMITSNDATCQNATNGPFTAPCIITIVNYVGQTGSPTNVCADPTAVLTAKNATVNFPQGLAFDADRNLYIAENKCGAVRKLTKNPATGVVDQNSAFSTLVGNNTTTGTSPSWYDASAAPSFFGAVRGLASAGGNDLYISTTSAVYLYDSSTRWAHRIWSDAAGAKDANNAFICQASTTSPYIGCPAPWATRADNSGTAAMAVDKAGNLYATDYGTGTVVKAALGTDFIGIAPQQKSAGPATQYVLLHGGAVTDATATAPFNSVLTTDTVPKPGCTPYAATGDNGTDCIVALTYTPSTYGIENGTLTVIAPTTKELPLQGFGNISTNPKATLAADHAVCAVDSTCTVVVTATVEPGINPDSTGLTVTGDMSACTGGSATQAFQAGAANTSSYTCSVPTSVAADLTLGPANAADDQSRKSANSNTVLVSIVAPPVAQAQSVIVTFNTAKAVTLAANGSGTLSYTIVTPPAHGTLSGEAPALTYTPESNFTGTDSFVFSASNGVDGAPATVTVNVLPAAPVAQAQSVSVDYNSSKQITLSATGTGALTYSIVTEPAHGTLSGMAPNVTYTPAANYEGTDTFTFKATDENNQDSAPATVSISVQTLLPTASDQSVTVTYNTGKAITLIGTGSGTLTYSIVRPSAHGVLSGTAPDVVYTPNTDYTGPDSFTFKVGNGQAESAPATVSINVLPAAPLAAAQSVTVTHNTPQSIVLAATGTEPLIYTVLTQPVSGTLTGAAPNLTYTPTLDYGGTDSFTFKVTDAASQESTPATVSITVLPSLPVAEGQTVTVAYNTAKSITLAATGSGTLNYVIVNQPAHGTLNGTAPNLTYAPNATYAGTDSFTFKVNNGLESNVATVNITVLPAVPAATPQSVTVSYNTAKSVTLAATGTGTLTYTILSQPAHGTLTGTAPNLTYTPSSNYIGPDSFTFDATDSQSQQSAPATVSVTVNGDLTWAVATGGSTEASVTAGGTAVYNLQVSGWTGATGTITFTCTGAPAGSFCTLSPYVATLNGTTGIPVTAWVKTNGAASGAAGSVAPTDPGNGSPWGVAFGFTAVAAALLMLKQNRMQWRLAGACAALLMVVALSGCGGQSKQNHSSNSGAGTYTVTVTATSGTVTKAMPLTLKVQ